MANQPLPTPDYLRKVLRFDPLTGTLWWRERAVDMFTGGKQSAALIANRWNSRHAGKMAFSSVGARGYHVGKVGGRVCTAHRVIWAIETGEWPTDQIDHLNGDKTDNRWNNLRHTSNALNSRNRRKSSRNKSGHTGVHWREDMQKWCAHITIGGKNHHLGSFAHLAEAIAARRSAEQGYSFTARHGRD